MTRRVGVLALLSAIVLPGPALGQTLNEVERPLLATGQTVVSADYGQFAFESFVAGIGFRSYSYFEPVHHVVQSTIGFGASKGVQLNVRGTYLLPTQGAYALSPEPDSTIVTRSLAKSLSPEVILRRGNRLELHVAGVTARSSFDEHSPTGNATIVTDTFATDALLFSGTWLPHPDDQSRLRRADLDGLLGPMLRPHRVALTWDGLWRRYRSTDSERDPFVGGTLDDTIRSTDARLRLGAAYGLDRRTQFGGDVYWQPPFNVSDVEVERGYGSGGARVVDDSRRLSHVFGWRLDERGRFGERFEVRMEVSLEGQSVTRPPQVQPASTRTTEYRERRLSAGATWLSRPRASGAPLAADLSGLYRPILEKKQLRLDWGVRYLRSEAAGESGHLRVWRVDASLGLLSSLEGSVYVGGIDSGVQFLGSRPSSGAGLRFRPSRWFDAYATLDYRPSTWTTQYPGFVLPAGNSFRAYQDLLNTTHDDDASFHVGVRIIVK